MVDAAARHQPPWITDDDLLLARELIAEDSASRAREHFTAAATDTMRNFALGYGDDNPLYADPAYGTGSRWGGQIAPPTMLLAIQAPLLGDRLSPEERARRRRLFAGASVVYMGDRWEWFRPVYEGDRIHSFGGIDAVERAGSGRDRALVTYRTVKFNQRSDVVAIHWTRVMYRRAERRPDKNATDKFDYASYAPADLDEIAAQYDRERPRGIDERHWEDVAIGDSISSLVKGPLTVTDMIVFHAGGACNAPEGLAQGRLAFENRRRRPRSYTTDARGVPDITQRVHWDVDAARMTGSPTSYDYGELRTCWTQHAVTDWMGDDAWLLKLDTEIRGFNYLGDTQVITGEIVGKTIDGARCSVDIALRATNQRGEVTTAARATTLLPSRSKGPAILPEPADDLRAKAASFLRRHGELLRQRVQPREP